MAQRKSSPAGSGASRPGGKPGGPARTGSARTGGTGGGAVRTGKPGATSTGSTPAKGSTRVTTGPATRPPARRKKTIVNQKQTPWGLIIVTALVAVFAVAVVAIVIATHKSSNGTDASNPYKQPELAAAKSISGLTYKVEANHFHKTGTVKYDSTPPRGGDHNGFWADCTGTVYAKPIADENAVHMLEHGAVWITYNADQVKGSALKTLQGYVSGVNQTALSPYPGLDSPISLQAWGYQLKVSSADDPRIPQFIGLLKNNKKTTPEYGASCSNPGFKANPSTFGHPTNG